MDEFASAGFTTGIKIADAPVGALCSQVTLCHSNNGMEDLQEKEVEIGQHLRITGGALRHWLVAQLQDSAAVGLLWLLGLYLLKVPWAPLWAVLAALLQFVPHLGPPLGLIGPVLSAALHWKDWLHPIYVLILYAAVAVLDGLLLQPYIMRRTAKVPIWASILAPIVLGFVIPFWGVLLAPPLLAVLFAYRNFLTNSRS